MRIWVSYPLLACLACSSPGEPEATISLETDETSYVATDDPDPRFLHATTVIVKFRNKTSGVVRINRCTASTTHPPYLVEMRNSSVAAWNPDITCATIAPVLQDVAAGQERTDTLVLHAPWQRLFNGQPMGSITGTFRLAYEVQLCGAVSQLNLCTLGFRYDYARSNEFTITTP
jgi:hypothetical protein